MFLQANIINNLRLANKLRDHGFEVYCPNENKTINDKTRTDITAEKIYISDKEELLRSNVFICQISEDSGTMWETGFMDCLSQFADKDKYYGVVGLITDIRLQTIPDPQKSGVDNQSFYINQFIVGGLKMSLGIYTDEDSMISRLETIRNQRERMV